MQKKIRNGSKMTLYVCCLTFPNYNNLFIFKYFQFIIRIESF